MLENQHPKSVPKLLLEERQIKRWVFPPKKDLQLKEAPVPPKVVSSIKKLRPLSISLDKVFKTWKKARVFQQTKPKKVNKNSQNKVESDITFIYLKQILYYFS